MNIALLAALILSVSEPTEKRAIDTWMKERFHFDYCIELVSKSEHGPFKYRQGATYYKVTHYNCENKEYWFEFIDKDGFLVIPINDSDKLDKTENLPKKDLAILKNRLTIRP